VDTLLPRDKDEFLDCLETVKVLEQSEFETYSIVKHTETQQHYLRYFLIHIKWMEGGQRDEYDHFLPIDSDDVLGYLFGEQPFQFPDNWRRPYLRSGNDNRLIPFDPTENYDLAELENFKQQMLNAENLSAEEREALTRDYFAKLDQILKKPEE